jgi:hypothetical protein
MKSTKHTTIPRDRPETSEEFDLRYQRWLKDRLAIAAEKRRRRENPNEI